MSAWRPAAANSLVWKEVMLTGNSSHAFEEQITDLQGAVAGLDLQEGTETSLEQKLVEASSALARGERDQGGQRLAEGGVFLFRRACDCGIESLLPHERLFALVKHGEMWRHLRLEREALQEVADRLGGVLRVPAFLLIVVTIAFAAMLAWSGATLGTAARR